MSSEDEEYERAMEIMDPIENLVLWKKVGLVMTLSGILWFLNQLLLKMSI
jgi:hypothetical protein